MQKSVLLRALQQEIRRHDFNYFVDQPPSIAQGGRGVVVPGCPACMKRINTMSQFLDHLAEDAIQFVQGANVVHLGQHIYFAAQSRPVSLARNGIFLRNLCKALA